MRDMYVWLMLHEGKIGEYTRLIHVVGVNGGEYVRTLRE